MKILQIDSSALGTQSATRELTQAIVQRWLDEVADIELVRRDLDAHPLPHLTGAVRSFCTRRRKIGGNGRSGRIRTRGPRFWRPMLYQLSYTPAGGSASSRKTAR